MTQDETGTFSSLLRYQERAVARAPTAMATGITVVTGGRGQLQHGDCTSQSHGWRHGLVVGLEWAPPRARWLVACIVAGTGAGGMCPSLHVTSWGPARDLLGLYT